MPYPDTHRCKYKITIALIIVLLPVVYLKAQIKPGSSTQPGTGSQALNAIPSAYGSGAALNYVRVWEAIKPFNADTSLNGTGRTLQEVKQSTQYFDGVGRLLQTVVKGA